MQKREKELRDMAERCGAKVVDRKEANGQLRLVMEAPNGHQHTFYYSMRAGGTSRHMRNDEADLNRWLREVCPELEAKRAAKKDKPHAPAVQTAIAQELQRVLAAKPPTASTPLDGLITSVLGPAAATPAPSPARIPSPPTQTVLQLVPAPTATITITEEKRAMEDNKNAHRASTPRKVRPHERNVLTDNQVIKLVRWLERRGPYPEYIEPNTLAAEAEAALGFKVTGRNVEGALRSGEIPFPPKPNSLFMAKNADEAVVVIARAFIAHLTKWQEPVPPELQALTGESAPRKLAAVG